MEANKVQGAAKSLGLDSGIELTYCERGEKNSEVIISGAFYFHTLMPVIDKLAEKYHVYGVVMRFDGKSDDLNADGTTNWTRQWGSDIYNFAKKLGIEKFHYFGKCHGTVPGWYLVKNHPDMLKTFASFFLAPHTKPANGNSWFDLMNGNDTAAMMRAALRKPEEGIKAKMAEMNSLGNIDLGNVPLYAVDFAKFIWATPEDCVETLKNAATPICYLFGTEDPLFADHYDSNIFAIMNTKNARTVILGGERHLMEIDCPERIANEIFMFIDESGKNY